MAARAGNAVKLVLVAATEALSGSALVTGEYSVRLFVNVNVWRAWEGREGANIERGSLK